jgi:TetR/AcrR family transcriptional repressor of multidrug resistance operon
MDKRTKILNAAEILLAERGFYGLSMKIIAQTAGITAGTIYCYFENKEALLHELHQYILTESAQTIFNGWQEQHSTKQKYDLLWQNTYEAVLKKPQRLTVIDMLYFTPDQHHSEIVQLDDDVFCPLINFYQQGIDEGRFLNWEVPALVTLSFDSAINLAKKVLKNKIIPDQKLLNKVRDASWSIIQKK